MVTLLSPPLATMASDSNRGIIVKNSLATGASFKKRT